MDDVVKGQETMNSASERKDELRRTAANGWQRVNGGISLLAAILMTPLCQYCSEKAIKLKCRIMRNSDHVDCL